MTDQLRILILEDEADRIAAMRDCLGDRFSRYAIEVYTDAPTMLSAIDGRGLDDVLLIALDHDLPIERLPDGTLRDAGTGRDVADRLAACLPACPVILHSTNVPAVHGMQAVLADAGWTTIRVVPEPGTEWVAKYWFPAVRNAIVASIPQRTARSHT